MNFATSLRHELSARALNFAQSDNLPHVLSYGATPVVCFAPYENSTRHGNFTRAGYKSDYFESRLAAAPD
jgi:hypothetical protein